MDSLLITLNGKARLGPGLEPSPWFEFSGDGRGHIEVGGVLYPSGSCDLPFTSSSLDADRLIDEIERHFSGAGWEPRCPASPDPRGWQTSEGGGLIGFGSDAAVPGSSRYWHCAWQNVNGDIISYHLQTVRMRDGRQPLVGYAMYTPRGDDR